MKEEKSEETEERHSKNKQDKRERKKERKLGRCEDDAMSNVLYQAQNPLYSKYTYSKK